MKNYIVWINSQNNNCAASIETNDDCQIIYISNEKNNYLDYVTTNLEYDISNKKVYQNSVEVGNILELSIAIVDGDIYRT
jgi:hypothetical protein